MPQAKSTKARWMAENSEWNICFGATDSDESDKTETERNGRAGPNSSISDTVRDEKLHGQV